MPVTSYRFAIVDDHPLFRGALGQALGQTFADADVTEAGSLPELMQHLASSTDPIDLILLDLAMPGVRGASGLLDIRCQHPEVPVAVISAHDDPATIWHCIAWGASGFVAKSQPVEVIRDAIRSILDGKVWLPPELLGAEPCAVMTEFTARVSRLTPQQRRVLVMLGEGLLNKQIAFKLEVTEATIKAHVSAILQKLGVASRTQAVIAVSKLGASVVDGPNSAEIACYAAPPLGAAGVSDNNGATRFGRPTSR